MSEATRPADNPADAGTAIPPQGGVLGSGSLRVTRRDLEMYAALVGVPQTLLIPVEPTTQPRKILPATARKWRSLTQSVARGLAVRVSRPDLSAWVRRMSGHARMQFRQAQLRFTPPARGPRP